MKLGLGLYRNMLNKDYYKFAKQCGCTHIVVHLVDYFNNEVGVLPTTDSKGNWGYAIADDPIWEYKNLLKLKEEVEENGLEIAAIENFSPGDWYDVLLDGPQKYEQIEKIKRLIKTVGKVGIPTIGYNFSIAGVYAHIRAKAARGGAETVIFDGRNPACNEPIPKGEVWNMVYDKSDYKEFIGKISSEELWERYEWFLKEVIPVAEKAGVKLALHPDDPPVPELRGAARLVYQPQIYQKVIDIYNSPSNSLEFCMGSIQEMSEGCIYQAIEQYVSQDRVAYVHFRNVKGKVPNYQEVFVDEGDIDMIKALKLYKKYNFKGVLIPDHTPEMTSPGSWHAGMAYALGYMKGIMKVVDGGGD